MIALRISNKTNVVDSSATTSFDGSFDKTKSSSESSSKDNSKGSSKKKSSKWTTRKLALPFLKRNKRTPPKAAEEFRPKELRKPRRNQFTRVAKAYQNAIIDHEKHAEVMKAEILKLRADLHICESVVDEFQGYSRQLVEDRIIDLHEEISCKKSMLNDVFSMIDDIQDECDLMHFFGQPCSSPEYPHIPPVDYRLVERSLRVGYFKFDALLGAGTFATVYKAHDRRRRSDPTPVAVKVMSKASMTSLNCIERLEHELSVLQECRHENIIEYKGVLHGVSNICIVTELAWTELHRFCQKYTLSDRNVRNILRGVFNAAMFLHEEVKVTHFDIKAENILLVVEPRFTIDGEAILHPEDVKLCDFGLCRFNADAAKGNNLTRGTPGFLAPELLSEDPLDGPSCDMWSIGALLLDITGAMDYTWHTCYARYGNSGNPNTLGTELFECLRRMNLQNYFGDDNFYDLVCNGLVTTPKNRLTARQALEHPWMIGYEV